MGAPPERMRIDKWLWAARFYRTRSLAADAIDAGHVDLNGNRAKPAREVAVGDTVELAIGAHRWQVTVLGLTLQRGAAPVAQALYAESPESRAAREQAIASRKAMGADPAAHQGRPTKRERRQLDRWRRGDSGA